MELIKKIKKYKLLRFFDIFIASLLTLVGTVSVVYILIFLNAVLGVGFVGSAVLSVILTQLYSYIANDFILSKIDDRVHVILTDIVRIISDADTNVKLKSYTGDFELRFENLTLESKLELMNYIKTFCLGDERKNIDNSNVYSILPVKLSNNESDSQEKSRKH